MSTPLRPKVCGDIPIMIYTGSLTASFRISDLLSRHVNKAHSLPEEGESGKKNTKKGRRKSVPSTILNVDQPGDEEEHLPTRRSSFSQVQPHLQAQSMYPHHPLLGGAPGLGWTSNGTAGINGVTPPHFSNPISSSALPGAIDNPMYANGFTPPFTAVPMRPSGSEHGCSSMGRGQSLSSMGSEFGYKKRACDHCNQSKVRCDFSDPCRASYFHNVCDFVQS